MRDIGRIVRLQIQRSSLKTGDKPNRVYDPAPLLPVPRLAVSPEGVLGEAADHSWVVDIHHGAHPDTKNPDGQHGVSLGFTTHYTAMRDRFGDRISLGCAGDNILVEADRRFELEDLGSGVALRSASGADLVRLSVLDVAHPCRPFTGWALGGRVETEALKSHLQFLDGGTRGFYCLGVGCGIVAVGGRGGVLLGVSSTRPTPNRPSSCSGCRRAPRAPPPNPGGARSRGRPRRGAGRRGPPPGSPPAP